jgi:hypothetical protein
LLQEAEAEKAALDLDSLAYGFKAHLDRLVDRWQDAPEDADLAQQFLVAAELLQTLPFEVNLWKPQNVYFVMKHTVRGDVRTRALGGDEAAQVWLMLFDRIGEHLGFQAVEDG